MGSPFDMIDSITGGGVSNQGQDPNSPQGAAATPSPFSRVFSPDSTGGGLNSLLGLIGRAAGVPTNAERQSAADAQTMQQLSGLMQTTGSPQNAIVKFLQTPQGAQLMARPGAADTLKRWSDTVTPPPITGINTAPGYNTTLTQGGNGVIGSVSNPTERTQNANSGNPDLTPVGPGGNVAYPQGKGGVGMGPGQPTGTMQNIAGVSQMLAGSVPKPVLDTLAMNTLNPNDVQQRQLAISRLVATGGMSQQDADLWNSGTLQLTPLMTEDGSPSGMFTLFDRRTGQSRPINPYSNQSNTGAAGTNGTTMIPTRMPGGQPHIIPNESFNADGSIDGDKLTGRKYMYMSSGPGGHILSLAGHVVRFADPSNNNQASQLSSFRGDQLEDLKTSILQIGGLQDGRLKLMAEAWRDLVPSPHTDAIDAYRSNMNLLNKLDQQEAIEKRNLRYGEGGSLANGEPLRGKEIVQRSREMINAIEAVKVQMPTMQESQQMLDDIRSGKEKPLGAGETVKELGGLAVDTVSGLLGGGSTPGAKPVKTQSITPQNQGTQPQQPSQQPASKLPAPADIGKMQLKDIQQLIPNLPPGPGPERDAAKARVQALKGGGSPSPAAPASTGPMQYNAEQGSGKGPVPLEAWLKNPAQERNLLYKGPNDRIEGAQYGSDGQWHVQKGDKWYTIVAPPKAQKKSSGNLEQSL